MPKCIGRMTQNNINPVNNNAIKTKTNTQMSTMCQICCDRSIRRILKLRNPGKKEGIFFGHIVPLHVHSHIYGQIIGGARTPPVALLGGPVAPPAPGSYSTVTVLLSLLKCSTCTMKIAYHMHKLHLLLAFDGSMITARQ